MLRLALEVTHDAPAAFLAEGVVAPTSERVDSGQADGLDTGIRARWGGLKRSANRLVDLGTLTHRTAEFRCACECLWLDTAREQQWREGEDAHNPVGNLLVIVVEAASDFVNIDYTVIKELLEPGHVSAREVAQ